MSLIPATSSVTPEWYISSISVFGKQDLRGAVVEGEGHIKYLNVDYSNQLRAQTFHT